jgi:hypothetical protein
LFDLNRQIQYLMLALYTGGKGVDHPAFVDFVKDAPMSLEDFYAGLQILPDEVWSAGSPLWHTTEACS